VPENVLSIITALISVAGALISFLFSRRAVQHDRVAAAEALALKFREPLVQAAFNLQSRLYNILEQEFLQRFLLSDGASAQDRDYAVESTLYVLGQYFCWVEIIRRESQYVDPRDAERNREVARQLEEIRDVFATSERLEDPVFRLFRQEQRALAEVMLVPVPQPQHGLPRWECMGYAAFIAALRNDEFNRWFVRLREDITALAKEPDLHRERLVEAQHALLGLIEVLDPRGDRVSLRLRKRL
jgi:hypothetical protein